MSGLAREVAMPLFRRLLGLSFGPITIVGAAPPSETRSRVFVVRSRAPIPRASADPLLVLARVACPVVPPRASPLWRVPLFAWLFDAPPAPLGGEGSPVDLLATQLAAGQNVLLTDGDDVGALLERAHARGTRGLTFQAVTVDLEPASGDRASGLVVFGPVRSIDPLALEGDALRSTVESRVAEDLARLHTSAPPEARLATLRIAELLAGGARDPSPSGWADVVKHVPQAEQALAALEPGVARAVTEDTLRYFAAIAAAGLRDDEVAFPRGRESSAGRRAFALGVTLPLAVPGFALYALPHAVSRRLGAALARRSPARDVGRAAHTAAVGTIAFPVWAACLLGASLALLPRRAAWAAAALVVASPFAALEWLDTMDARAAGVTLRGGPVTLEGLRAVRADLVRRLGGGGEARSDEGALAGAQRA